MRCLFLSLVLIASCQVIAGGDPPAIKGVYLIDFSNDVLVIPVVDMERSDNNRLVFIEISEVENPQVLHIRTHHEHLFLCIVNADSYRA